MRTLERSIESMAFATYTGSSNTREGGGFLAVLIILCFVQGLIVITYILLAGLAQV